MAIKPIEAQRKFVMGSLRKIVPINTANRMLVSRNEATTAIGALVKAHTAIQYAPKDNIPEKNPDLQEDTA